MFWLFGTRQEWPSRLRRLATGQKIWFAFLTLLAALFVLSPREAEARPRYRDNPDALRLRLTGSYGWIDYDSISRATNGRTSFVSAPHLGRSLEAEKWLMRPTARTWPKFGVLGDFETYPAQLFGETISYSAGSAGIAWRVSGSGQATWNRDELMVSVSASVQVFSDVRATARTQQFDLFTPGIFGMKTGFRYGTGLTNRLHTEVAGYWIIPFSLYRTGSAVLDNSESRSFGGHARLDLSVSSHFDIGVGLLYQKNRISYRPIESQHPQTVEWNNIAPTLSIQFWLHPFEP